jgi:hypothetical protein
MKNVYWCWGMGSWPLPVFWELGSTRTPKVFIVVSSQCYRELGKNSEARRWMKLALELPDVTNEVKLFFNCMLGQHSTTELLP